MALSRKRPTQRMGKENGSGNKSIDSIHPSPPSPFRLGWKSVIPSDYPYPIPSTQEPLESQQVAPNARLPQTGSSEESHSALPSGKPQATCPPTSVQTESTKPLPEINNPHQVTQVQKPKAAAASSTQLTAKHREENQTKSIPSPPQPNKPRIQEKPPNTKALFIPKTKKPIKRKLSQIPDGLALDNNINPVSKDPLDSIQPIHTSLDTRNNIEKDPFADWDSPSQHEIEAEMKSRTEETNQEDTERIQETKNDQEVADRNLEEEMKEIEKPLKLDRNLLELIIRMVLLQIKLSESSKNHVDALEVLNNFKKQTIGLHKTHAVLFEKKLTEAVDKLLLIQSEYNRLSNLIDIDLKSSIEISVSKNKSILNAPSLNSNGIFGDNWIPKPVIHLESSAVSSSMDNLNPRSTFDQPTKSSLPSDLPKESIKSSNINNNDSWGWGNDTENTTTNPDPTHESENKVVECPWGAEEPEEITPKPNEAQPGPATNPEESFGWGGDGEGNDNHRGGGGGQGNYNDRGGGASWSGKSNNNDTGGWSNQNVDNDSGGWNNQNSNTSAINMDTNNSSEFRPRDSGWGGMRNGRGGRGGGFSNDQSGFRGRGFGFRGDRGFRSRGGGDRGGFTGRSRGFDGSGFGGRGRGFGNRGGSWSGSGDSGFNNNENNSFSEGFRGGNGNGFGFGETSQGFNSGYSGQNDNRDKGGWGDDNGSQSGFGNAGNDSKGVSGGDSKNTFGGGWYNSGDDSYGGFNASGKASGGGGDDSIMKTGGGGGFGMSGSTGGDRCQPPKVPSNRAMVQYDTLAPGNLITNDGNEWSSANPSTTLQPSQVNATGGKQAGDISTNDDNGWGSPPSKEHVEIPSGDKNFRDLDGGSPVDNLPLKLDYGGETLINKTAKDLNHINPPVSAKEAIETAPVNTSPNTKMVPGNEENECPW